LFICLFSIICTWCLITNKNRHTFDNTWPVIKYILAFCTYLYRDYFCLNKLN
jgi:hypothetical protein